MLFVVSESHEQGVCPAPIRLMGTVLEMDELLAELVGIIGCFSMDVLRGAIRTIARNGDDGEEDDDDSACSCLFVGVRVLEHQIRIASCNAPVCPPIAHICAENCIAPVWTLIDVTATTTTLVTTPTTNYHADSMQTLAIQARSQLCQNIRCAPCTPIHVTKTKFATTSDMR